MTRRFLKKYCLICAGALPPLASLAVPALASPEEDLQTLGMLYETKDLVVSATWSPRTLSKTTEDITLISAVIRHLNLAKKALLLHDVAVESSLMPTTFTKARNIPMKY